MKLAIRKASLKDKGRIKDFIIKEFGKQDYIPFVLESWLNDKNCIVNLAEEENKIVGMNSLIFLPDGSCWLQGARIHKEYRRKGLATILGKRAIELAKEKGYDIFRLTCRADNLPAISQVKKMGFNEVAKITVIYYHGSHGTMVPLRLIKEEKEAFNMIASSREFELYNGFYWQDYRAVKITENTLGDFMKNGRVVSSGKSFAMLKENTDEDNDILEVCFIKSDKEKFLQALLAEKKESKLFYIPLNYHLFDYLASLNSEVEGSFILFELKK